MFLSLAGSGRKRCPWNHLL